jgi:retinol dehydrogenase 14
VPDLSGKTALVTGASSGIGLEASVKLARMGAEVVIASRDQQRTQAAADQIRARSGSQKVSCLICDFTSQAQIRQLASDYRASHARLDILVNNAGSVSPERRVTEDGIEQTFAVNHLGPFLLTNLLLDLIEKSAPARIVNVSSVGHRLGDIDFDNLQYERGGYFIMRAYARSKLASVLFTRELGRRLDGKGVTVNCLHPGGVATRIWSHAPWFARPFLAVGRLFMISAEKGGDVIVHLASGPELEGRSGLYFERLREMAPSKLAQDDALAKKLWDQSAKLVHLG